MIDEFTTAEVAKYTEIPRRTLYRWREDAYLPSYKAVAGRGPGQSDLHDKAVGVWGMFLDEYGKSGGAFSGQEAGKVWLLKSNLVELDEGNSRNNYDGPYLLQDSAHIVGYLRTNGFELAALIFRGKLGFDSAPSRDRFCEIRIVSLDVAHASVPQFLTPRRRHFMSGMESTHLVKSIMMINLALLSKAFDYAIKCQK